MIACDLPCSVKLLVVSSEDGNRSRHDREKIRSADLLQNDLVLNKKHKSRVLRIEITEDIFGIFYGHFSIIWGRDYVCGHVCACVYIYICGGTCACVCVYTVYIYVTGREKKRM